tara:strand:+ start:27231 stop:27377 length:147 start_codon:yes stop_codon:yes gene_type:complete
LIGSAETMVAVLTAEATGLIRIEKGRRFNPCCDHKNKPPSDMVGGFLV